MSVPVSGLEMTREYGPTVDVTNFRGSVTVVADPGRPSVVQAKVHPMSRSAPRKGKELAQTVNVSAEHLVENGRRVLRVVSTPTGERPADVAVDLFIRVPKTEAVHVRNSDGPVELVRIDGPVTVDNGYGGTAGGSIYVRTGAAMTDPVSLTTTAGPITYQVGPGSSGRFEIVAEDGRAEFFSRIGEVREARPTETRYRGILNDGENPVTLRTGSGVARALVLPNADTHGPDRWDGWPTWPKYPKPVGRLGGYHNDEPVFRRKAPPQE